MNYSNKDYIEHLRRKYPPEMCIRDSSEYTAIVRDKLLRCPMLVVCSRNQDATTLSLIHI